MVSVSDVVWRLPSPCHPDVRKDLGIRGGRQPKCRYTSPQDSVLQHGEGVILIPQAKDLGTLDQPVP
jgi:hypothetical protein